MPRPAAHLSAAHLSALLLTGAFALSACSTEPTPTGPVAAPGGTAPGAAAPVAPPVEPAAGVDPAAVLTVDDQTSAGPTVNVQAAAVTAGGWVVVSADAGRNVLGVGAVPPGATPALVQVSLADIITAPTELTARLYDDADRNGIYGEGDLPVSNAQPDDDDDAAAFPGELESFSFTGADVIKP